MILKNILEKATEITGTNVNFEETGDEQTLFINSAKCALMRLCGEFADIKTVQKVQTVGGMILYSSLMKQLKRIIKVKIGGESVAFREEYDCVLVGKDGEAEVTYAYYVLPNTVNSLVELPPIYNVDMLALGTAGEYCYRKGLYKEGEIYDKRFSSGLMNAQSFVKHAIIKAVSV